MFIVFRGNKKAGASAVTVRVTRGNPAVFWDKAEKTRDFPYLSHGRVGVFFFLFDDANATRGNGALRKDLSPEAASVHPLDV
jgi:hypothetical protein